MRFFTEVHGHPKRIRNRFGGDHRKEILDSTSFPRIINFLRMNGELLKQEMDEEGGAVDRDLDPGADGLSRDVEIEFTRSRRFSIEMTPDGCLMISHRPDSLSPIHVNRNGSLKGPFIPKQWFRRGPATPSWV